MTFFNAVRRSITLWIGVSLICLACDQTTGCSDQSDYRFPDKDKIHSAIQVRLTDPGLELIGQQATPLIQENLPEELSSCLPGDSGVASFIEWRYCNQEMCPDGEIGCTVNVGIGGVEV